MLHVTCCVLHIIMPKGSFWNDTFEKIGELTASTAKKATETVRQTFDPTKMMEQVTGADNSQNNSNSQKEKMAKKQDHTKLDFDKLQNSYQNQDKQKTNALRNKLFQLVKSGDEKVLQEKEQEKKNREEQTLREEQDKKKRLEETKRQQNAGDAPAGKERKSILGKKKPKAKPEVTVETKANASKQ